MWQAAVRRRSRQMSGQAAALPEDSGPEEAAGKIASKTATALHQTSPNASASFVAWYNRQAAVLDLLSWGAEFFLLALATLAHDLAVPACCDHKLPLNELEHTSPTLLERTACGCGPKFWLDARAFRAFPCGAGKWQLLWFTLRHLPGNLLHAFVRCDFSVLLFTLSLMGAVTLVALRPDVYFHRRNTIILTARLCMAFGNTLAAVLSPSSCLAATTAPYYVPPLVHRAGKAAAAAVAHVASGGAGPVCPAAAGAAVAEGGLGQVVPGARLLLNKGLLYVALKAAVWGRVLLSYQLRYGFVEWLNGSLVGAMVSYRMYGRPGLVLALHPLLLMLQLLVYYALPCVAVWWLESKQRARFRAAAAGPSRHSPGYGAPPQEPAARHGVKSQLLHGGSGDGASVCTPAGCTQSSAETHIPASTPAAAATANPTATCPPTRTNTSSATLLDSTAPTTSLSFSSNSSRRSASDGGGGGGGGGGTASLAAAAARAVRNGDAAAAAAALLHLGRVQSGASALSDCTSLGPTAPSSAEWDETVGLGNYSGASSRVAARAAAGAAAAAAPAVAQQQGMAPAAARVLGYKAITSAVMVSAKVRDHQPCNVDGALFNRTASQLGGLFAAASRGQHPHPQPPSTTAPAPARPPPPGPAAAAAARSGSDASSALGSHYTASVSASACHSASSSPGPDASPQRSLVAAASAFGRPFAQSSYVVVRGCVHLLGVVSSLVPRSARDPNGGSSSSSQGASGFGGGSSSVTSNGIAAATDAATSTDGSGDTFYFSLCSGGSGAGDGTGPAGVVQPPAVSPLRVVHVEVDGMDELPSAEELRLTLMQHHLPHAGSAGSLASEVDAFPPPGAPAGASNVDRPPPYTVFPPAIAVGPQTNNNARYDQPDDQVRENDVETQLDTDPDVRADAEAGAGVEVEVLVWDGGCPGRVRIVAVGSCGTVLLDQETEVEVDGGELGGGWHPNQGTPAGRIRLRLPPAALPGMAVVHVLPCATAPPPPAATAAAATAAPGGAHRPLVTLPLLVVPSWEAAQELCALHDDMAEQLALRQQQVGQQQQQQQQQADQHHDATSSNTGTSSRSRSGSHVDAKGGQATPHALAGGRVLFLPAACHVAAYHDHFLQIAGDLAYLMRWLAQRQAVLQLQQQQQQEQGAEQAEQAEQWAAGPSAEVEAEEQEAVAELAVSVQSYLVECGMDSCLRDVRELLLAAWPQHEG